MLNTDLFYQSFALAAADKNPPHGFHVEGVGPLLLGGREDAPKEEWVKICHLAINPVPHNAALEDLVMKITLLLPRPSLLLSRDRKGRIWFHILSPERQDETQAVLIALERLITIIREQNLSR